MSLGETNSLEEGTPRLPAVPLVLCRQLPMSQEVSEEPPTRDCWAHKPPNPSAVGVPTHSSELGGLARHTQRSCSQRWRRRGRDSTEDSSVGWSGSREGLVGPSPRGGAAPAAPTDSRAPSSPSHSRAACPPHLPGQDVHQGGHDTSQNGCLVCHNMAAGRAVLRALAHGRTMSGTPHRVRSHVSPAPWAHLPSPMALDQLQGAGLEPRA